MRETDPAYVSVLQWPDGSSAHDHVEALVAACAIDPFDAEQKSKKGVPQVILRADRPLAEAMLQEFSRRGVMAFAPLRRQFAAIGQAPRIKRLMPMHDGGGYVCEMWREEGSAFRFSDVFCFVRAKLRESKTSTTVEYDFDLDMSGQAMGHFGHSARTELTASHVRNSQIKTTDILDIYLRDGKRLRLDSDKLNFDVLGDQKSYTDHNNMKLLTQKLRDQMPRAMFDEGFRGFVCPPEFSRERIRSAGEATLRTRSDVGPFEFYSVWAYLMYAHLLGG